MAVTKQYTGKPLQVDDTPENMLLVRELADQLRVSQAQIVRELLHSAKTLRALHAETFGESRSTGVVMYSTTLETSAEGTFIPRRRDALVEE